MKSNGKKAKDTRRSKYELYLSLLNAAADGATVKTRIMQSANIDCRMGKEHFDFLVSNGMIAAYQNRYNITAYGQMLLEKLNAVKELIGTK